MAQLSVSDVISAAVQLQRAAQWNAAADLLRATTSPDPAEQRALTLALAEVAVDQDFAQATTNAPDALTAAGEALDESPDPTTEWDLRMLNFRKDYGVELFRKDEGEKREGTGVDSGEEGAGGTGDRSAGEIAFGPAGRDAGVSSALALRAAGLGEQAPDDGRRGMVSFYAGLIADNLQGDAEGAFVYFTTALALGERVGDELLVSLALRHLGDHAHTGGDLKLAREQWERSTELRQKVGHVFGALAQQALLAVLLRDEGDAAASRAVAAEVNRWARQLGLPHLAAQAKELIGDGILAG